MRSGAIAAPGRPGARAGDAWLLPAPATPGPGALGKTTPSCLPAHIMTVPAPAWWRGLPPACEPVL